MRDLRAGDLVRIMPQPTDDPRAGCSHFWCEAAELSLPVNWGTCCLVVNVDGRSSLGNELVHFIHGERVFAITKYQVDYSHPAGRAVRHLWCELVGDGCE